MRMIDADILEREGWYLSRNYVVDSKTRCFESKAIKKVPTAHPELNEWCHDCKEYDTENDCCPRWGQVIRTALADAQPKRKTGKWTPKENRPKQEVFICSECGGWAYSPWIGSRKTPKPNKCKYSYCPNCGARMSE